MTDGSPVSAAPAVPVVSLEPATPVVPPEPATPNSSGGPASPTLSTAFDVPGAAMILPLLTTAPLIDQAILEIDSNLRVGPFEEPLDLAEERFVHKRNEGFTSSSRLSNWSESQPIGNCTIAPPTMASAMNMLT